MSNFTFILNPEAGKGKGRKLRNKLVVSIRSKIPDAEFVETTRPGEAADITREAQSPSVVAIGGDGTINEVANGIAGTNKSLGVIPIGSGNDFIKAIGR